MSADSLQSWLEAHGLGKLLDTLLAHDIDLDIIGDLAESDFAGMGISLGQRKRLLRAIAALHTDTSDQPLDRRNADPSGGERRQLTVVFCDLVGSTSLSQQLDLEDLRDVIRDYQDVVSHALKQRRGFIARFMGDGVLAYFGYPTAMEDDAYSAVQASQDILATFLQSPRFTEPGLAVRIGIATGVVVVGDIIGSGVSEEHAVLGQTPNLAARLQAEAAPNQLVVDQQTWQLVHRRYVSNTLQALQLKGFERPVTAFELPLQRARQIESSDPASRLIGRAVELNELDTLWRQTLNGQGAAVLVSGEPGIGKSRLVSEFRSRQRASGATELLLECSPHAMQTAFYALVQHLRQQALQRVDMLQPASMEQWRAAFMSTLIAYGFTQSEADFLIEALALVHDEPGASSAGAATNPAMRRNRLIVLFRDMLKRLAAPGPLLLLVEDIHDVDPSTLEVLQAFIESADDLAALVVITGRPEFDAGRFEAARLQTLTLRPLQQAECAELIAALGKLPDTLAAEILRKADGVPLFVEEITRALFQSGQEGLSQDSGDGIPSTLQSLLMARFDRLGAARELAQLAAVIGDDIEAEVLQAASEMTSSDLQRHLDELHNAGVLVPVADSSAGNLRFRHRLLQEIAYQTLLRDDRRRLHLKVGQCLQDGDPELGEREPERLARHFGEAQAYEQAVSYWHRAARRAASLSANQECGTHIEHALQLLEKIPDHRQRDHFRLDLNVIKAGVLRATRGPGAEELGSLHLQSLALCEELGRDDVLIPTLNGLYSYKLLRSSYTESLHYADRLLAVATRGDDITGRMIGHRAIGAVSFNTGELSKALENLQRSRALYDPALHGDSAVMIGVDHQQIATSFYTLTQCLLGWPATGIEMQIEELKRAEALGHAHNKAQTQVFLVFETGITAHPRAWELTDELYHFSTEHQFPMMIGAAQFFRGSALHDKGQSEAALDDMLAGAEIWWATGTTNYRAYTEIRTGEVLLSLGEIAAAGEWLARADSRLHEAGEWWCLAELYRVQAEQAWQVDNDADSALALLKRAIEDARSRDAALWEHRSYLSLQRLLEQTDRNLHENPKLNPQSELQRLRESHPELDAFALQRAEPE